MEKMQFKHTLPIQLRFNDVDSLGHVNNTVYFSFYDLGKTAYFNEIKNSKDSLEDAGLVIANIQVNFLLPVFPNEKIAVQTAVSEIGNKSFKLFQQVIDADTEEIKCVCQTVMVGYNIETKTTESISDAWKQAISDFEGRDDLMKTL